MEFGAKAQGFDSAPADLSVSLAPRERGVSPSAEGAPSLEQQNFRREVFATAQSAFVASAAHGAVRAYEATLRAIAPKVAAKLGDQVSPMSSDGAFYAFCSSAALLGPRTVSSVSTQPGVRRSYVKPVKGADAFWRVVRDTRAVFDPEWPQRIGAFW